MTQFYDFRTTYENMKMGGTAQEFYDDLKAGLLPLAVMGEEGTRREFNRQAAEWLWHKNGQPYYRVWPNVMPMLTNVGLDIPIDYLTLPFEALLIRLPIDEQTIEVKHGRRVQTILFCDNRTIEDDQRRIFLWIDTGERDPIGHAILNYLQLDAQSSYSIEEGFRALPKTDNDLTLEQAEICLRLAVSIAFLATGTDKLISPDVLSKDLGAWLEALKREDHERRATIEARAVRRGKKGWNVGAGERLFIRRPAKSDGEGTGRELSYSHQRGCHFRLLPSKKVIFIRQVTVRPDLPPKAK